MPNEYINYEQVRRGATEIVDCATKMQEIFDSVSGNMRNMTESENWKGVSSNALQNEFREFQNQFPRYIDTVKRFAALFNVATDALEANESDIYRQVDNLS